jgi:CRISPR-associated endoribonuclease Cas6
MLLSAVIPLIARETLEQNAYLGRACHALFLNLVGRADPSLAEELHGSRGAKPFTVSALFSWDHPHLVQPKVREGERYWIRFTSLEADLSRLLAEEVLPNLRPTAELGPARFHVGTPITKGHPWARTTTAEALVEEWFGGGSRPPRRFELEFASPTAYRRIHRNIVLPLPAGIFQGYLRAWNRWGRPAFERDLLDLVEAEVHVTRYRLETRALDFGPKEAAREPTEGGSSYGRRRMEPGFVGRCAFTIFHRESALRRVIHLLADFSQFCGTGYKTTQGMGQTRLIPSPRS